MHDPPLILIVDDNETNRDILHARLASQGYATLQAGDGEVALEMVQRHRPDLMLLDVMMPRLDGIETCRRLRSDRDLPFLPIILVTSRSDTKDVVEGLEAGADEYLTKPFDHQALVARVRSVLRLKALHDQVQAQAADLAAWNRTLEDRVARQVEEIARVNRLRLFLSPQVAELVVSSGSERLLQSHRRDVTIVFCDLRGFTAFSEAVQPEDVMAVLREYHDGLGALINKFGATVEHFAGDGLMVLFNAPIPCPDPAARAVRMAVEMRACVAEMVVKWRRYGRELGFGVGIAHGDATLGCIGFEGRLGYAAIGRAANLAARLCGEARHGQILIDRHVQAAIAPFADLESLGDIVLKGFGEAVPAFQVRGLK